MDTSVLRVCTVDVQLDSCGDSVFDENLYCLQWRESVHDFKNMLVTFQNPSSLMYHGFQDCVGGITDKSAQL